MFIRKEHSQVRKYILNDIEYSKKKGVNIDITHVDRFARGNVMIPLDRDMSGYYSVVIDGVTVYDKTGQNLKKYGFSNNPKRTGTTIATVERTGTDDYYVYSDTEDLLQIDLTRDTDLDAVEARIQEYHKKLIIFCKHIYIPPLTVSINADEFVLVNPIITDEFLHSIDCSKVTIETDGYHPSYKALNCTEFSLTYNADLYYNDEEAEIYAPDMPDNANTVKVVVQSRTFNDIVFIGTENIQKLTLDYAEVKHDIYDIFDSRRDLLEIFFDHDDERFEILNVPELKFLNINKNFLIPTDVLYSLETLIVLGIRNIDFFDNGDIFFVSSIDPFFDDIIDIEIPLERLVTFSGDLVVNNMLKSMPNLKILYGSEVTEIDNIPRKLREYYINNHYYYWHGRINDVVDMSKYLMSMPTIKRMPLYLSNDDYQYPIGRRNDVYYDIYLPVMDRIYRWDTIEEALPEQIDDFLEDIPQLREALIANRRYMTRTGTLASLLK